MSLLRVEQPEGQLQAGRGEIPAVQGVSFTVDKGETVALSANPARANR